MSDTSGNVLDLCCDTEMRCICPVTNTFKYDLFSDEQLFKIVEYIVDINYRKKRESLRTLFNARELLLEVLEEANNKDIYDSIMLMHQQNPNNEILKKTMNLYF